MSLLLNRLLDHCSSLPTDGVSISFSGGVDSLLLALCSRKHVPVQCVVVGAPDSEDVFRARRLKSLLDLTLDVVELDTLTYLGALSVVAPLLGSPNPMEANLSVVMYLAFRKAIHSTVLVGHGADEHFGGYRKYTKSEDWTRLRDEDILRLRNSDMPRYRRVGAMLEKTISAPYLDPAISSVANGTLGKGQIIAALEEMGLAGSAISPKKAMQFGSGSARLLKCLARHHGVTERDLVLHYMEDRGGV